MRAQAAGHGVDGEITRQLEEVPSALDQHSVETSLKQVSIQAVLLVEGLCVCAIQVLHAPRKIGIRRLHNQVIVVRHQAVAVTPPASSAGYPDKESQEAQVVF